MAETIQMLAFQPPTPAVPKLAVRELLVTRRTATA